jgi:hypothetical protein
MTIRDYNASIIGNPSLATSRRRRLVAGRNGCLDDLPIGPRQLPRLPPRIGLVDQSDFGTDRLPIYVPDSIIRRT